MTPVPAVVVDDVWMTFRMLAETERVASRYLQPSFSEDARREEERQAAERDRLAAARPAAARAPISNAWAPTNRAAEPGAPRLTAGSAEMVEAWLENETGNRTDVNQNHLGRRAAGDVLRRPYSPGPSLRRGPLSGTSKRD